MSEHPVWQDREWLEQHYVQMGLSAIRMGHLAGCSDNTVSRWLSRYGLSRQGPRSRPEDRFEHDAEKLRAAVLERLGGDGEMTVRELYRELHLHPDEARRAVWDLERAGLVESEQRGRATYYRIRREEDDLLPEQEESTGPGLLYSDTFCAIAELIAATGKPGPIGLWSYAFEGWKVLLNGTNQVARLVPESGPVPFQVEPGQVTIAWRGTPLWCGSAYDEPGGEAFESLRARFEAALDDAIATAQEVYGQ